MISVVPELWIRYTAEDGSGRRERLDKDQFIIGRHSSSDLCIPDGRLSREHIKIRRQGEAFLVSDLGSTNGTKLNGSELEGEAKLTDGDELDLGNGIKVAVEIEIPGKKASKPEPEAAAEQPADEPPEVAEVGIAEPATGYATAPAPESGSSIPTSVFIIAPLLGLVVLVFVGVLVWVFSTGGQAREPEGNDFVYTKDPDDPVKPKKSPEPSKESRNSNDQVVSNTVTDPPANITGPTQDPGSNGKAEQNGAAFLRKIAQNDAKAFLTSEQAAAVNNKIKQLSSTPALADNINSARRSASQIRSLATSKNLKPQFLAAAAITKLGSSKGDVLQAAQSMADVFAKLETQIGNELSDDSLLMVAAFDQGAAGDFMKMRNMLQDLATKFPESSRSIRTIWFLHKNGKITDTEFDFALRFVAVGTISQNPKDFSVNCEALSL
jgi:hypothetical protein